MAKEYTSSRVRIVRQVGDFGAYTRSEIRYRSDDGWVTGILNRPKGAGRSPHWCSTTATSSRASM